MNNEEEKIEKLEKIRLCIGLFVIAFDLAGMFAGMVDWILGIIILVFVLISGVIKL